MQRQRECVLKPPTASVKPLTDSLPKNIILVSEESALKADSWIMPHFFRKISAGKDSRVIAYQQFLSEPEGIEADILILRSSKLFPQIADRLKECLQKFRSRNPEAVVVLSVLDPRLQPKMVEFMDSGLAQHFNTNMEDYMELLERGMGLQ